MGTSVGPQSLANASTLRHHALGATSRARILEVLAGIPGGLDAKEIATQVDLHHNTVRSHLNLLVKAGVVARRVEERSIPGRPRVIFQATEVESPLDPSPYELLAKILTSYLAGSAENPQEAAINLGQAWGRYLSDRQAPFQRISKEQTLIRLLDQFAELGFQPELTCDDEGDQMLLHRCPFGEIAREEPDVICSIHLGLMRGALAEMGGPVAAARLLPMVKPSLCVAYLETTAS